MLHVDVYFFKNEEKIFVFKNIRTCVDQVLTTAFYRGSFELKITTEYRKINETFIQGLNNLQIMACEALLLIGIYE